MKKQTHHIIVIGGGLSGLTAARQLLRKNKQIKITVLQANNYLGGRTKQCNINGCIFDLGAQFIGPKQNHVIQLALQSKNQLVPVQDKGKKIIQLQQSLGIYTGDIPNNVNILALIQMQLTIMKINRMAKKVPLDNPRNCLHGYKWDSMSAQTWIQQNLMFKKTRIMVEGAIRVIMGVQLSQISFLYFLYYVHQSGDFESLITVQNGLQQKKTSKGTQHMSVFLGQQIQKMGGKIKLNSYVNKIQQNQNKVTIHTNQQQFHADYIIIAMPPSNAGKIIFEPKLSIQRRTLCERSFMGNIIKVIVLYQKQYWAEKGFTGQVLSDCHDGPAMNVFDDSRVNKNGQLQPALTVFVGGGVYRYWKERQDFKQKLLQKLSYYFKDQRLLHPIDMKWNVWDQQQSINGGPICNFPPGVLSQIQDLRKPEGRIHWAGTELARKSIGFMDGAIQSGKRVADEIEVKLKGSSRQNERISKLQQKSYLRYNRNIKTNLINKYFEWW